MGQFENLKITVFKNLLGLAILALIFSACESHHDSSSDKDSNDESTALENPFIHTAYFWFKEGASEERKTAMIKDTENLRKIASVKGLFYGSPAATDRPVVEKSYDFAVVVHFEDLTGHDAYQNDQIHLDLLANHSDLWSRVMVTDIKPH